ncbi:MAG: phosphatase PAP2 family protein [bacterium]|nr:phosphatase PAP2 family protein [bacterium]
MTHRTKLITLIAVHAVVLTTLFAVELPFATWYSAAMRGAQKMEQIEHKQVRGAADLRVAVRVSSNACETLVRDFAVNSDELFEYQLVQRQDITRVSRRLKRWVDNDFWAFVEQLGLVWIGLLACIFIWVYDPAKRKYIIAFIVTSIITGLLVDVIKKTTGKIRPEPYFSTYAEYFHVRFLGFLKGWTVDAPVAFPSGHSTQAFVTATFLAVLYPRVRWMFYSMAACTAFSRVLSQAHWLSDIYAGMLLGCYSMRGGLALLERLWRRFCRPL